MSVKDDDLLMTFWNQTCEHFPSHTYNDCLERPQITAVSSSHLLLNWRKCKRSSVWWQRKSDNTWEECYRKSSKCAQERGFSCLLKKNALTVCCINQRCLIHSLHNLMSILKSPASFWHMACHWRVDNWEALFDTFSLNWSHSTWKTGCFACSSWLLWRLLLCDHSTNNGFVSSHSLTSVTRACTIIAAAALCAKHSASSCLFAAIGCSWQKSGEEQRVRADDTTIMQNDCKAKFDPQRCIHSFAPSPSSVHCEGRWNVETWSLYTYLIAVPSKSLRKAQDILCLQERYEWIGSHALLRETRAKPASSRKTCFDP